MRRILILFILILLTGCSSGTEINCIYKSKDEDNNKSIMKVTLKIKNNIVVEENLTAQYIFNTTESAQKNYSKIESVLEKDRTIDIRQDDEKIIVEGKKDVSEQNTSKKTKIKYYEKLGYICK